MIIHKEEFLKRFTLVEISTILEAAKTSPLLAAFIFRFNSLQDDLDDTDPTTVQGIHLMETSGLIAPGRALAILNAQPTEQNMPTILLNINQVCLKEPTWYVITGGEYPITQPVECSDGVSTASFQANYIATGEFA